MKKNKFFVGLLFFLICVSTKIFAQGYRLYFQEYLAENLYLIHPAMAGVNLSNTRFNFGTRTQWIDLENSPQTQFATFEYQASAQNTLGVKFYNDINGYHQQTALYATYVYRIYLNDEIWNTRRMYPTKNDEIQEVSFGLSVGSQSRNLDSSSWRYRTNDPLLTTNETQDGFMGINVGIAYVSNRFSAHVSVHNIALNPNKNSSLNETTVFDTVGFKHLFASLQYEIYTDSGWNFEPSVLWQYLEKTKETAFDSSLKVYRLFPRGRLWIGAAFRQNNLSAVVRNNNLTQTQYDRHWTPLFGVNFGRLKFAYQYSIPLGAINMGLGGIHFFNLGFQP